MFPFMLKTPSKAYDILNRNRLYFLIFRLSVFVIYKTSYNINLRIKNDRCEHLSMNLCFFFNIFKCIYQIEVSYTLDF